MTCPQCNGTGVVKVANGWGTCAACWPTWPDTFRRDYPGEFRPWPDDHNIAEPPPGERINWWLVAPIAACGVLALWVVLALLHTWGWM